MKFWQQYEFDLVSTVIDLVFTLQMIFGPACTICLYSYEVKVRRLGVCLKVKKKWDILNFRAFLIM